LAEGDLMGISLADKWTIRPDVVTLEEDEPSG
jgi:hypothetical protein